MLVCCFAQLASAQIGNGNPTGPAGVFNGNITTGCSYDALTGNAMRVVVDLAVAGSVGAYPLAFARTSNSRNSVVSWGRFGEPGAWQHSYDWQMVASNPSSSQAPPSYEVLFPDGRDENFTQAGARAVAGIKDMVTPLNLGTMLAYLVFPDGGKVEFKATQQYSGGQYSYTYVADAIVDPHGLRTTLTYNPDGSLFQITEPGGRWIQIYYMTTTWYNSFEVQEHVIDHITASDSRGVQYNYALVSPYLDSYTALLSVSYYGNSNIQASYTYQAPNGSYPDGAPLLATCDDPMYAGPMKKISYVMATSNAPTGIPVVSGQILSENSGTTGDMVSQLNITFPTWRSEERGDGFSRTFVYNGAYIQTISDFNGNQATPALDANGFPLYYKDFKGNQTDYTSDPTTGNILTIKYPATPGDVPNNTPRGLVTYTYGSASCPDPNNKDPHYLYSVTDEGDHTTIYLRDANKRIITINYPDGATEKFTYDPTFGEVATHQLKTGGTETYSYYNIANGDPPYENGLLKEYRDAYHTSGNANARYQYDPLSRVSVVTDALGTSLDDPNHSTSYIYNWRGERTTTTLPVDPGDHTQHTVVNAYNDNTGTLTSVTDPLGNLTSYTYDDYRRPRSVTTPGHNTPVTANYFYDANGTGENYKITTNTVTFAKLPAGETTNTTYDNNLRKKTVTAGYNSSDAATTQYGYDNNGNLTSVTDPLTNTSTMGYDERNRAWQITDTMHNTTTVNYDAAGRKGSVTRANGQATTFDLYDQMNRLLQQTAKQTPEPDAVTKYAYYPSGLLHTMTDPNKNVYTNGYDLMARKTGLSYPDGSSEAWSYNNTTTGTLNQFTNRAGAVDTLTYDNFNRVTLAHWNDSLTPDVTTVYDPDSRVTSIINSNSTITRTYYNDGLLNTETNKYGDGINRTVTYTYDADGRRASLVYPNSAYTFTYTYSKRSQLETIVNNSVTIANYGYDVDGNLKTRALNNSTSSSYGYDAMNRCLNISHALNGTTRTFGYQYDSVGNREWVKRDGGTGDVYSYDLSDQVTTTQLNIPNPDTTAPGAQTIVYDANGNRTTFSPYGPTDTYTTNALNQYTVRDSVQAVYDSKGNMTTGFDGSSYTYDAQNRLLSGTRSGTLNTF
ncbi:MAG: RHS repeat protein, partial [Verrucomicrobia bacterium]|nr:RHS repeat protein [Verrucomicrobiota bacterium]